MRPRLNTIMYIVLGTQKKEELKVRKKILRKDIRQCEAEIEAHEWSVKYCEAYLDGAHPTEAKRIASAGEDTTGTPAGEQMEESKKAGQNVVTQQDQAEAHGAPEVESAEMEMEIQDEPQLSDQESDISTPRSDQSSIKSDEARMVDITGVTSATEDMTLDMPQVEETSAQLSEASGTHAETQD